MFVFIMAVYGAKMTYKNGKKSWLDTPVVVPKEKEGSGFITGMSVGSMFSMN
jgi:hypothetical protein